MTRNRPASVQRRPASVPNLNSPQTPVHGGRDQRTLENALSLAPFAPECSTQLSGFLDDTPSRREQWRGLLSGCTMHKSDCVRSTKTLRARSKETHTRYRQGLETNCRNPLPSSPRGTTRYWPTPVHPSANRNALRAKKTNRGGRRRFEILLLSGGKFDGSFAYVRL